MGTPLHHGLHSRQKLSFMCSVTEQVQDIILNLENSVVADPLPSQNSGSSLNSSLHTQVNDLVQSVRNSVLSLYEKFKDEISLEEHEKTDIEPFKESLFGVLESLESNMKSSPLYCMNKEVIESECNKLLDLCLEFSLKIEEMEKNYLRQVCDSVKEITETLCSRVHPDLILETAVDLKTALLVCLKAFYTHFKDLLSPDSYCLMIASVSSLKRTIIILLDSMNAIREAALAHRDFAGKEYVLKQLKLSLDMLIAATESASPFLCQEDEIGEPGEFVNCIDKILTSISVIENEGSLLELQELLQKAIVHSLAVAQLSFPASQEQIKKVSQDVLVQAKLLTELYESVKKRQGTATKETLQSSCENMISEVESLEQQVNLSVLELIAELITGPMQPVCDLMDAATQNCSHKELLDEEKGSYIKQMGDKFHQHTDWMYHICRFAAACCTDKKMIYALLVTVKNMELLDVEIVPAVLMNSCGAHHKDVSHLKLLMTEWCHHVRSLQQIMFKITDAPAVLKVIDDSIRREVKTVSHFLYDQEGKVLKQATDNLLKRASCAIQIAAAFVQEIQSVPDLSILHKSSKNLRKSIRSVYKSSDEVFSNLTDLEAHRSLQKHCIILSSCVRELQKVHEDFYSKYDCAYLGKSQETSKSRANESQGIHSGLHDLNGKRNSFTCGNTSLEIETDAPHVPVMQETMWQKEHEKSLCDAMSSNIDLEITAILDGFKSFNGGNLSVSMNSSPARLHLSIGKSRKANPEVLLNSVLETRNPRNITKSRCS